MLFSDQFIGPRWSPVIVMISNISSINVYEKSSDHIDFSKKVKAMLNSGGTCY